MYNYYCIRSSWQHTFNIITIKKRHKTTNFKKLNSKIVRMYEIEFTEGSKKIVGYNPINYCHYGHYDYHQLLVL